MDRETLKHLVETLPDDSPKLLEYLKLAREKGWSDIVQIIGRKLGLVEGEKEKKPRHPHTEILKQVFVKPLGKSKMPGSWDYGVDFVEAKKVLRKAYEKLSDANLMPYEAYVAILYIQLVNGMRIREAIRAFKTFLETRNREFLIQAQKKGNARPVKIPDEIMYKQTYRSVLLDDDRKLRDRIEHFALKWLGTNTHSLRYAFITFMRKAGVDVGVTAKITGHKKLDRIVDYTQTSLAWEILRKIAE